MVSMLASRSSCPVVFLSEIISDVDVLIDSTLLMLWSMDSENLIQTIQNWLVAI